MRAITANLPNAGLQNFDLATQGNHLAFQFWNGLAGNRVSLLNLISKIYQEFHQMARLDRNNLMANAWFQQDSIYRDATHDTAKDHPNYERQQCEPNAGQNNALVRRHNPQEVVKLLSLVPVGGSLIKLQIAKHRF